MTVDTGGDDAVLRLERLAAAPMHEELAHFVGRYADWIGGSGACCRQGFATVRNGTPPCRICTRMRDALSRMRNCVEMLRTDELASESFQLANRAMLDQMIQADRIDGKEVEPGTYRWRPFQLAFLLTVMVSTIREIDDYRDVLDLIWFPTGGGKTEAYLGLIAFLISLASPKIPRYRRGNDGTDAIHAAPADSAAVRTRRASGVCIGAVPPTGSEIIGCGAGRHWYLGRWRNQPQPLRPGQGHRPPDQGGQTRSAVPAAPGTLPMVRNTIRSHARLPRHLRRIPPSLYPSRVRFRSVPPPIAMQCRR